MKTFLLLLLLPLSISAQEIRYSNCQKCWNADSLGSHRVVIELSTDAPVAKVLIPWRRNDQHPEKKRIIIQSEAGKKKVLNHIETNINRENGEIYFEPIMGKGIYYIYYLPMKNEGRSNYPKGVYLKPENTSSATWLQDYSKQFTNAKVLEFQSIDSLNSFYPMEIIATAAETASIIDWSSNKEFLVFPEDRNNPIKMQHDLPLKWMKKEPQNSFQGRADKGEYFAFQLGIYALKKIDSIGVLISDLKSSNGYKIPERNISCINLEGISYDAKPLKKTVQIEAGFVQSLWCGVDVPVNAKPGVYSGTAYINANGKEKAINIQITVTDHQAMNAGENEPWKQTRLKWLNSKLAQENTVIAPYTPIQLKNNQLQILGRTITLAETGLPQQIQTYFNSEMTALQANPKDILAKPMQFNIINKNNETAVLTNTKIIYHQMSEGTVAWEANSSNQQINMHVNASLEFDGFMHFQVAIKALQDLHLNDINMQLPFTKKASKYIMGLGLIGSQRPNHFNWNWNVATKNQDGAWIGDVNAGLQFSLRDEKYVRPLNTNFYLQKPLLLPSSWGNDNKGGVNIDDTNDAVLVNNYSGAREMKQGEILYYNFTLLVTPFHTLNTDFQWDARFFHAYKPIDTIKASGASIVNIHHNTAINPWINYPFIEHAKMKSFIDSAHVQGMKVKIYNTVRELSNHAYETFALKSLGHEIYSTGTAGGSSWLQEHFGNDYIPAWYVPEIKDAAIVNSGMSRWHNYYIEGMNWLVKNVGIDGIYLDDVAFDRITMKRVKRVLTSNGHPGIIDLHSANQYNKSDGFNNSANLYMEHFPYLNKLWFGEYFDYEKSDPDFYLTEVSGIPFGLMGEMLEGGGNPYRGMVYGMTNRMPWSNNADPRALWKLWNDFGMKGSKMVGYWSENCAAKTNDPKVLATVYQNKQSALIAFASWSDKETAVVLQIDWKKIGIDPNKAIVTMPEIKNFQAAKSLKVNNGNIEPIQTAVKKGAIVWIKEKGKS